MGKVCRNLRQPGIYAIVNTVNGHRYIGSAVNLKQRWYTHQSVLRRNVSPNEILQNAWNRYGEPAFDFRVLEYVEDKTELLATEQQYIDSLLPEYNICKVAGNKLGVKLRPESVELMRSKLVGRKRTEETRQRQSASLKGRIFSPETLAKMRGRVVSEETRAKLSATKKSKPQSQKAKDALAAMHASRKGVARPDVAARNKTLYTGKSRPEVAERNRSPEMRAKVSDALKGRVNMDTIAKLAEINRGRKWTPEQRVNTLEARRLAYLARKQKKPTQQTMF